MDIDARRRLKAELSRLGIKSNELSKKLGYAETYVSRIVTGDIKEPSATRIREICQATGIDWTYVATGELISNRRRDLLDRLADAPESVIDEVADFVQKSGLGVK